MKNKKIYLIFMSLLLALAFLPFGATKKIYAYAFDEIEMLQESDYYKETYLTSVSTDSGSSTSVTFSSGTYFADYTTQNVVKCNKSTTLYYYFIRSSDVYNDFYTSASGATFGFNRTLTNGISGTAKFYIRFYYDENVIYDSYSGYVNTDYLEFFSDISNFRLNFYRYTDSSLNYFYYVSSIYINMTSFTFDDYLPQLMSFDVWGVTTSKIVSFYQIGSYSDYDHIDNLDDYYLGFSRGQSSGSGGGYTQTDLDNSYQQGYNSGLDSAANDVLSLHSLVFSIIDAPFNVIRNAFNFEIFGINFSSIVTAIVTALLIVWVIKRFR